MYCRHDLTESTREMAKRGTDDLKRLATMQSTLVSLQSRHCLKQAFNKDMTMLAEIKDGHV